MKWKTNANKTAHYRMNDSQKQIDSHPFNSIIHCFSGVCKFVNTKVILTYFTAETMNETLKYVQSKEAVNCQFESGKQIKCILF